MAKRDGPKLLDRPELPTARTHGIRLERLGKAFGRHQVLAQVSATFAPGRVCALLGGNGAGKSTLLGLLALLVRPSAGALYIGEVDANAAVAAGYRKHIGLLGHDAMVYRPLTGRQNLALFAELHGHHPAAKVAERWLERLDLAAGAGDRPAATYSRGMLQRLALGRALMGTPEVLLLDEPFSGLDRKSVAMVRAEVAAASASGAVVVVVSHELAPLVELAQHGLVLEQGRVVAERVESRPLSHGELTDLLGKTGAQGGHG